LGVQRATAGASEGQGTHGNGAGEHSVVELLRPGLTGRASAGAVPVPVPGQCRAGPVPGQCRASTSAGPAPHTHTAAQISNGATQRRSESRWIYLWIYASNYTHARARAHTRTGTSVRALARSRALVRSRTHTDIQDIHREWHRQVQQATLAAAGPIAVERTSSRRSASSLPRSATPTPLAGNAGFSTSPCPILTYVCEPPHHLLRR
jgi:hypothetical protein